jgi:hypothetical protein
MQPMINGIVNGAKNVMVKVVRNLRVYAL